ncbi:MAG TPA: LPS assembly lipoprotein LptE [Terriglobales bacterium]|nr:LPS assembly lipoprotein LptE [Terriglobales bacterium]
MNPGPRAAATAAALLAAWLFAGCGYHFAGRPTILPPATHVVAVLPFQNHTGQPQLSQAISAAVAQEFERRTHYHVQASAVGCDAALHGDLRSVEITPVTFDATSGRATTVEVVIHVQAWMTTEPGGHEVYRNNDLVFHDEYQISPQQSNFIEEDSSAFRRLSQSLAQTLVADIVEAF